MKTCFEPVTILQAQLYLNENKQTQKMNSYFNWNNHTFTWNWVYTKMLFSYRIWKVILEQFVTLYVTS